MASVQKLPTSQLEALKVNDLERFVEDIRSVYLDVEVEDKAVRRAYARLVPNSCANANLTGVQRRDPFERAARELVKVDIKSTLPLSDNTWQMEWIETITDRQGNVLDTPRFKATITTQTVQPKTKRR